MGTTGRKPRFTVTQIAQALESTGGFISQAALNLDTTPRTVERYIKRYPRLQDILWDINCRYLDLAESEHIKQMKDHNYDAVKFHLRCKGKNRGWVERQEITGADGAPVKQTVEVVFVEGNDDAG
jgi:hypothetical protein